MFEYLVSSNDRKRLIRVETKSEIYDEICKIFSIPARGLRLQMYLDSFGEYADVEDAEELPASGRLLAVCLQADEAGSCAVSAKKCTAVKMENLPR